MNLLYQAMVDTICFRRVGSHLSATIDGLSEPDVLLGLGGSVPVLLGNACGVCEDASLAGVEVAEDLDGIRVASLVGVDVVVSYREDRDREISFWHQYVCTEFLCLFVLF